MTQKQHEEHKRPDKVESDSISTDASISPTKSDADEKSSNLKEDAVQEKKEELVTIPLQEYAAQLKEIDDLKTKVSDYSDGWQRERADFTNYRARVLRDQEVTRQDLVAQVVKKYLEINDDIELALKNSPKNNELEDWVNGIRLIAQKLQNILESEGVQRIPAENEIFDPNRHEAIATEENPQYESGHVIEIIQQGYTIGDRVIRPARVKVAK